MDKHKHNISFGNLAVLCYLCTIITGWSYGNSFPLYIAISIVTALFAYGLYFSNKNKININLKLIISSILVVTLVLGLINGDLESSIMVNISLLIPISLSALNINYDNIKKQVVIASIVNLGLIILIDSAFEDWNSNSLAFMIFCGITIGMVWVKISRKFISLLCSTIYLVFSLKLLLATGSRNAGIVILICFVMLLIPTKFYKNRALYRVIYLSALLLTVFSVGFQVFILNDSQIMEYLLPYTTSFSDKEWGMDTHYLLLQEVIIRFDNLSIFSQLFGNGVKVYHCHNLFYQCLFFYGYVGTTLIYIFYVCVFEWAYKLIEKNNDILSLSCFIILIGHFLLQISEVYMLGAETSNVMSLLPVAVILQRWHSHVKTRIA